MKISNRACNKRAITLDISILQNNKNFLELYPPIDLSLAEANKQGTDRWYNDLYIHVENKNQVYELRKQFKHPIFYTYGNETMQFGLSKKDQLLYLVNITRKKLDIFYDEIIYIDQHGSHSIENLSNTIQPFSDKPKVAVILAGQPRLANKSLPILFEWLEGTEYKIFAHAWDKIGGLTMKGKPSEKNIDVKGFKYTDIDSSLKNFIVEKLSNQYISFGNSIKDPKIPLHNDAYDWSEEKTYENLIKHEIAWGAQGFPAWLSWWNSYNCAIKSLEQSNLKFDIVIRSRWDNFYELNYKLIDFLKNEFPKGINENTIYIPTFDQGYSEDPRNYIFYEYFHSHDILPKDHFWFGTQTAQTKLLKYWLDLTACSVLEHNQMLFDTRRIPFPEFFLLSNIIKLGFNIEISKIPINLGRAGCKNYRDFDEVKNHTFNYYQSSIENN
tara:strand:- start:1704 stop:3026 length:1323 start_codon:yes stop_codon:yes gene_type:complete